MIVICVKCEKRTTIEEAEQRTFNSGGCAYCNGVLVEEKKHHEHLNRIKYLKSELKGYEEAGYKT